MCGTGNYAIIIVLGFNYLEDYLLKKQTYIPFIFVKHVEYAAIIENVLIHNVYVVDSNTRIKWTFKTSESYICNNESQCK